ncbi:uncharacterized protein LOC122508949 isoform X2 [Leptopilina heterotoma]|nr:uncharacterized protein LOC122508949 isoform X2 [Leptopilina heterotoma]XP_043478570.1 uncharacterized protein LOC122508949 isoform X2 [Leptopilina heterotoma]
MTQYQQVSVDLLNMVFTACTYLALAGVAWIFLRLLQACFWLPKHLKKQNNVQQMLQDKVESYEKYVTECEEKEKLMGTEGYAEKLMENQEANPEGNPEGNPEVEKLDEKTMAERWKERRECLEMLKRELKRVQEGGDPYDWDHLLDDTDDEEKKETNPETKVSQEDETTARIENLKTDEEILPVEEKKEK